MGRKTNMKNAKIEAEDYLLNNYNKGRLNERTFYALLKKITNLKKIDAVKRITESQKEVRKFSKLEKKYGVESPKKFTAKEIKKLVKPTKPTEITNRFYIKNIDTVGVFIKDAYTILKPKNTIEDLYENIKYGFEDFHNRHPNTSVNWIGVLYKSTDDNKVVINTIEHKKGMVGRTIGKSYIDSLEIFKEHLEILKDGYTSLVNAGSDPVNKEGEVVLDTTKFYLTTAGNPLRGKGKSDKI
jgi:hypothetical protein